MPKQLYLLDTVTSTKISDSFNIPHSFNVSFPFKVSPMKIKSITLKSVEMPYYFTNVRVNNGSASFGFTFSYSTWSNVKLSPALNSANYTISGLISAINTAITAATIGYTSLSIVLSQYTYPQTGLTVCRITTNATSLTLDNTLLTNQILGYTNTRNTTGTTLDGTSPINISHIDTCLYMHISNLPVVNNNNSSSFYTFKIPLNITNNLSIAYLNDSKEHQTIDLSNNSSFILDKLDIRIFDRFGFLLCGYYDYTLTLIIEYDDDVNKNQIQFLNLNN